MSDAISRDFLTLVMQTTPEEQATIKRFLKATPEQQAAVDRFLRNGKEESLELEAVQTRYFLRKGLGGWRVVFEGRETVLPDEKGVAYVSVLLAKPGELLTASELANRAFGDAVIEDQRNVALDDRDSLEAMRLARRRCQAVLGDPDVSETEREEARAELESIDEWARKHGRGTEGNEQRQVRAIRQALRRLLDRMQCSGDQVLRAFGDHLEKYLWEPSTRGGQNRMLRMRAGLAGRFMYESPEGVEWRC
jgi:hypothetical protein